MRAGPLAFEMVVNEYYAPLYRFALSLTRQESEACDLTQQTFYIWATKGHQLKEPSKIKSWLFTTLHREYLHARRRQTRFPHEELTESSPDLPALQPEWLDQIDGRGLVELLGEMDEMFQAPVALFYLEDCSYKDIAAILDIPLGTVKSRLARGLAQLQELIAARDAGFKPRPANPS